MIVPVSNLYLMAGVLGGIFVYIIRVERRITKIMTDITWIKKRLNSRNTPREEDEE